MEVVCEAALKQGKVIGHDGVAVPVDVADVMPAECICDGSGYAEVKFMGQVIARPKCPKCGEDDDG